jgi:hypothetical protein
MRRLYREYVMRGRSAFSSIELEVGRIRELSKGERCSEALAAAQRLAAASSPSATFFI